jgi:hypothetical protein
MRELSIIKAELDAAIALYRENVETWTRSQLEASNETVRVLQQEMSDAISSGANACPDCDTLPIGMIRRYVPVGNIEIPIYEVGCSVCPPIELENGKRRFHAAQGGSVSDAVINFNNGFFVEK